MNNNEVVKEESDTEDVEEKSDTEEVEESATEDVEEESDTEEVEESESHEVVEEESDTEEVEVEEESATEVVEENSESHEVVEEESANEVVKVVEENSESHEVVEEESESHKDAEENSESHEVVEVMEEESESHEVMEVMKEDSANQEVPNKKKKESKTKKEPKPKFSSTCFKCNKLFKNEISYTKHTLEQQCYKSNEITYCKLCNLTLTTHNDYKKHLYSLNHINNIGCNAIEKINTAPTQTIHHLDPFLNKNDADSISSKNLGNSFTFVFDTGQTQTVTLKKNNVENNTTSIDNNTTSIDNIITKDNTNTKHSNTKFSNETQTLQPFEPTERQTKIINFLKKQIIDNKSIELSGFTFYKMLDNKLQLEDYKGLQKIITNLDINDDYKENYIAIINNFISLLVKEKTNGKKIYKDKDISQLVINLTS